MAKQKHSAEDLEGWIMMECSIECSKCKKGNTLMLVDEFEAQEDFFKEGWRQVDEECLCPKCFKKLKK